MSTGPPPGQQFRRDRHWRGATSGPIMGLAALSRPAGECAGRREDIALFGELAGLAVVDAAIVGVSLALFVAAYAVALLTTRPARVPAPPASPDLGDEPPAVVNLLANRWRLTEDASESTLLDLAARGHLELRQPGDDPRHTTIHVREREDEPLLPYEQRVLDRVRTLAVDGVLPVMALTFRNTQRARQWNRRLHHEVIADARARGLSRRRFSPAVISALSMMALVSAAGVTLAAARMAWRDDDSDLFGSLWVGLVVWGLLSALAGRPGERDTPGGRTAATRWLGVRRWLRAHEEFADLPPAAVAVWDRYLSYGAALGVTRATSAVLDLGMGDRRRVWSSYGGRWRRVRVRYPRFWYRYGRSVPRLLARGMVAGAAGAVLVRWHAAPREVVTDIGFGEIVAGLGRVDQVLWAAGWLLLAYGGYVLVRTLLDLVTTRTLTGEVLWIEKWRVRSSNQRSGRSQSTPWLDYLALDDGTRDRTTAWGLPRDATGTCHDRDTVRIRVRPWSRRIVELHVLERGRTRQLVDAPAAGVADNPVTGTLGAAFGHLTGAVATALGAPGPLAEQVLNADEVSRALAVPVQGPQRLPAPGPLAAAMFTTEDRGRQVLMVGVAGGRTGQWVLRRASRGTAVPAVGDEAYVHRQQGAVRLGDSTVVLTLLDDARSRTDALPWLLQQAATRVPHARQPDDPAPAT